MAFIGESDARILRERFASLVDPVQLVVVTAQADCRYCNETRGLAEEVAALSDHITVETVDLTADPERAARYGIDKAPAIALLVSEPSAAGDAQQRDTGVRFFGIPLGYEFATMVDAVVTASRQEPKLSPETAQWLAGLDRDLHLQVFVTPTCPYCPRAVSLAHRLALASPYIRADMVEATEFPELAERYEVMGVPRTVINDTFAVEGAVPEAMLLDHLREALAA